MRILSSIILALGMCQTLHAQQLPRRYSWPVYGKYYISSSHYDYSSVAREITKSAACDYDRAQMLFEWMCDNIAYDPTNSIRTADECWDNKKGVCQAYCELYYRMAKSVDLKVELIGGEIKSSPKDAATTIPHVWLLIKADGASILADPTLGAGFVANGQFFARKNMMWFDVNPYWMIFTHLPDHSRHQLILNRISRKFFLEMPYYTPHSGHKLNMSAEEAFDSVAAENEKVD